MPRCWVIGEGAVGAWPAAWDTQAAGPSLTLTPLADGTIEIDTDADAITVTVTGPELYRGSWTVQTADLDAGPVALLSPRISGSVTAGATVSVIPGLWIYDGSFAAPTHAYQWFIDGTLQVGETGSDLVVPAGAEGALVALTDTATDANGSTASEARLGGTATLTGITGGFRVDAAPFLEWSTLHGADAEIVLEAI
ncbi:MAG: hypothetical protein AAFQ79_04960 [Pseudomonadota bacterium]